MKIIICQNKKHQNVDTIITIWFAYKIHTYLISHKEQFTYWTFTTHNIQNELRTMTLKLKQI